MVAPVDQEAHDDICVSKIVACPASDVGCTHQVQRGDLSEHISVCPILPLKPILLQLQQQQQQIGQLQQQLNAQQQLFSGLQKEFDVERQERERRAKERQEKRQQREKQKQHAILRKRIEFKEDLSN